MNEAPGKLTGYNCEDCKNRGYVFHVRENAVVAVECKCTASRRSIRNLERSGLKGIIDEYTFANYEAREPWQREARQKAVNFITDNYGKWFCAFGAVGSGKTHLCTAICGELLKAGEEVRYMLWRDEAVKLKGAVTDSEAYSRLIEPFKRAEVLYIDDLFKTERGTSPTAADINLAFELLNYRYINKDLITLISSELRFSDLLNIDEALGSRIYQRSKDYALEFAGQGKNWRLR